MKQICIIILSVLFVLPVSAKGEETVVFTTRPQMHCEACEVKVKDILRFEKGVKNIETSIDNQTILINFNPKKTTKEKLQKSLEKKGYKVTELQEGDSVELDPNEECPEM